MALVSGLQGGRWSGAPSVLIVKFARELHVNQDTGVKVLCPDSSEIQSDEFRNRDARP